MEKILMGAAPRGFLELTRKMDGAQRSHVRHACQSNRPADIRFDKSVNQVNAILLQSMAWLERCEPCGRVFADQLYCQHPGQRVREPFPGKALAHQLACRLRGVLDHAVMFA